MSDKELEEYINKIEPNFDSHFEKGTIEMSNEYYNLLEEKMARLINKNQELKEQLTTYQILHRDCKVDNLKNISKIEEMENQQKKFIEYLEYQVKLQEELNDIHLATGFEEILSKYKEIIGSDINVGSIGGKE